jgi:hypothetical protein
MAKKTTPKKPTKAKAPKVEKVKAAIKVKPAKTKPDAAASIYDLHFLSLGWKFSTMKERGAEMEHIPASAERLKEIAYKVSKTNKSEDLSTEEMTKILVRTNPNTLEYIQ